jgi:hypothetical protein
VKYSKEDALNKAYAYVEMAQKMRAEAVASAAGVCMIPHMQRSPPCDEGTALLLQKCEVEGSFVYASAALAWCERWSAPLWSAVLTLLPQDAGGAGKRPAQKKNQLMSESVGAQFKYGKPPLCVCVDPRGVRTCARHVSAVFLRRWPLTQTAAGATAVHHQSHDSSLRAMHQAERPCRAEGLPPNRCGVSVAVRGVSFWLLRVCVHGAVVGVLCYLLEDFVAFPCSACCCVSPAAVVCWKQSESHDSVTLSVFRTRSS